MNLKFTKMNIIPISRYTPYDHIPLSREVLLNSLLPSNHVFQAPRFTRKINSAKHSRIVRDIRPILVFGEIEWLVSKLVQQANN